MASLPPLAVFAELSLLAASGEVIAVTAAGPVITVSLPRLRSQYGRGSPLSDRSQRKRLLASLHEGLRAADLTLRFEVKRRVVAQLRPESKPTLLSRLMGLGAIELRVIPCLLALGGW